MTTDSFGSTARLVVVISCDSCVPSMQVAMMLSQVVFCPPIFAAHYKMSGQNQLTKMGRFFSADFYQLCVLGFSISRYTQHVTLPYTHGSDCNNDTSIVP